jgi:hypothetical protein
MFTYARFSSKEKPGYEVSSAGDNRFSALNAVLEDGRSIEMHYQLDVKGYSPGGTDWKLGKGKPGLNPQTDLWSEYLKLWWRWCKFNPKMLEFLREIVEKENGGLLTDKFASTDISQARALAEILNTPISKLVIVPTSFNEKIPSKIERYLSQNHPSILEQYSTHMGLSRAQSNDWSTDQTRMTWTRIWSSRSVEELLLFWPCLQVDLFEKVWKFRVNELLLEKLKWYPDIPIVVLSPSPGKTVGPIRQIYPYLQENNRTPQYQFV